MMVLNLKLSYSVKIYVLSIIYIPLRNKVLCFTICFYWYQCIYSCVVGPHYTRISLTIPNRMQSIKIICY
jgi:hypothetical protein